MVAGAVTLTGCLGSDDYDVDAVKAEAEQTPYDEMSEGDRIHVERGQIRQVPVEGNIYFVYVEEGDDGWENDVFARWDGERFEEGDTVEFWGVVEGTIETEEGRVLPEVTVVDMQSAD